MHKIATVVVCLFLIVTILVSVNPLTGRVEGEGFNMYRYICNIIKNFPLFPSVPVFDLEAELDWDFDFSLDGLLGEGAEFSIWDLGSYLNAVFGKIGQIFSNVWAIIKGLGMFLWDMIMFIVNVIKWLIDVFKLLGFSVFSDGAPAAATYVGGMIS